MTTPSTTYYYCTTETYVKKKVGMIYNFFYRTMFGAKATAPPLLYQEFKYKRKQLSKSRRLETRLLLVSVQLTQEGNDCVSTAAFGGVACAF